MGRDSTGTEYTGYIFWLLVIGSIWGTEWAGRKNNATAYTSYCSVNTVRGACSATESTGERVTYRADQGTQSVTYWGEDERPSKFNDCAIMDGENWSCQVSGGDFSPVRIEMVDGIRRASYPPDLSPSDTSISKWHWWRIRVSEWPAQIRARINK